jgi:hypothetical protein
VREALLGPIERIVLFREDIGPTRVIRAELHWRTTWSSDSPLSFAAELGSDMARWVEILAAVARSNGSIRICQVANELALCPQNVRNHLVRLETTGLAKMTRENGRFPTWEATKAGHDLVNRLTL